MQLHTHKSRRFIFDETAIVFAIVVHLLCAAAKVRRTTNHAKLVQLLQKDETATTDSDTAAGVVGANCFRLQRRRVVARAKKWAEADRYFAGASVAVGFAVTV